MSNSNPYEDAARRAAELTDEKYASEISSLCRFKDEEINQLFPKRSDKDSLLELLKVVNSATEENEKVKEFKENIENLGSVAVRLIKFLV